MPSPTDTERGEQSWRIAVLADSDTRWKWGGLTAQRLVPDVDPTVGVDGLLLRGRATPTPRQLREVGVAAASLREVTVPEFLSVAGEYDLVVLSCVGGTVQAMLHGLAHRWNSAPKENGPRPVLVTGYVGVVYEKLTDGLLLRSGADLVLANSRSDAERFRSVYRGVGAAPESVVECALPFLGGKPYAPDPARPFTVTFAVQPSVPGDREGRLYLLNRAVEHARRHPDRQVLIKLRSKPGEQTTHVEELPYQRLAERLPGGLPANCRLVYGHMGEVLDGTDLLVTVSSTAALESLHRGIPTGVLTDLGIRESLGNHHFVGSGCLVSWDELDGGRLPAPDPLWTARHGVVSDSPYEAAFDAARDRVAELLGRAELPPIAPYYTPTTAPGYLPGVLARHGLEPDGAPRVEPPEARPTAVSAVRRAARDAVRRAARGAYRHGVQRVAPVIRRMGQL
ncbi:hypothetical protein GL263_04065 [Streptomyces durbertensis]|uniref:Uncharacterized protein n=1 Tax=Streptomyces durbertensis TaxID=2448886 RepID=A0ABR6EBP1_9ACTN|nr:DUF6716 putative glycosyltransferase [Streptomyces durbertensis]MBB1242752.1 hypothetical protein [Streptomyces durbertensis]